jgi:hypothetical protein
MKIKNLFINKVKITAEMVGQDCIITNDSDTLRRMEYNNQYCAEVGIDVKQRSVVQLRYLFAAFRLIKENMGDDPNFNTIEKVKEQVKLAARFVDSYFYYDNQVVREKFLILNDKFLFMRDYGLINKKQCDSLINDLNQIIKNGKTLNIKTKSLSFKYLEHYEACKIIDSMLEVCCEFLQCTREELEETIKQREKNRDVCTICGKKATQKHHKFSQMKDNIAKYSKKVIDMNFNLLPVCHDCHSSHASPELCAQYILKESDFDELILQQENALEIINFIKSEDKKEKLLSRLKIGNVTKMFDGEVLK